MPPMGGVPVSVPASAEQGRALAQARLDAALDRLRATGAVADGEVGDLDPMRAIEQSLTRRHFDEILVSTLPARWSRWLRQDLPSRVERKFNLPVSYVSATGG
jgi:GABA permease